MGIAPSPLRFSRLQCRPWGRFIMATRKSEDNERLIDRDLTALAREGKLLPAHGADTAVAEVLGLLTRGGKHPLLSGEPGVGKSALVQEVARRIAEGRVD